MRSMVFVAVSIFFCMIGWLVGTVAAFWLTAHLQNPIAIGLSIFAGMSIGILAGAWIAKKLIDD